MGQWHRCTSNRQEMLRERAGLGPQKMLRFPGSRPPGNVTPPNATRRRECPSPRSVPLPPDVAHRVSDIGQQPKCRGMLRSGSRSEDRGCCASRTALGTAGCGCGTWERRGGKCCAKMLLRGGALDARRDLATAYASGHDARKCCAGTVPFTQGVVGQGLPPDGTVGTTLRRLRNQLRQGRGQGGGAGTAPWRSRRGCVAFAARRHVTSRIAGAAISVRVRSDRGPDGGRGRGTSQGRTDPGGRGHAICAGACSRPGSQAI
jgi:hypothetical protein